MCARSGKRPQTRSGSRGGRLDGRTSKPPESEITIDQLEEKAYRELLWALAYISKFDLAITGGRPFVDPIKKQRNGLMKVIKAYGFDGAMQVMAMRSDACKLLTTLLSKKKIARKGAGNLGDQKYLELLYSKIEMAKDMVQAVDIVRQEIKSNALTPDQGQAILDDLQQQAWEHEDEVHLGDDGQIHDPLSDLKNESLSEAMEQMENEESEDADS